MDQLRSRRGSVLLRAVPIALGFLGMLLALLLGIFTGRFISFHLYLAGFSIAMIVGGLLWLNTTKLKETLYTLVYTVFVLLCAALIYLMSANRPWRYDLTADKVHSLSPLTEATLRQIEPTDKVYIQAFAARADHDRLQDFLKKWQDIAPQLQVQLFDARGDLDVVAQMGTGNVQNGQAFLLLVNEAGEVVRRVDGPLQVSSEVRENQLTNLLARLLGNQDQTMYYVTGYGERRLDDSDVALTTVMEFLVDAIMPLKPLRLAEGRIPADAGMLIIAAPLTDMTDFELELLTEYLDQGGKLLMMIEPIYQDRTLIERFERLLAEYFGLPSPNQVVVDPLSMTTSRVAYTPITVYTRHPITMATNRVPFRMDFARPLTEPEVAIPGMSLDALLVTNAESWSESATDLKSARALTRPQNEDQIGRQFLAVAAQKRTPGGRFGNEMRAVIIGDADAFSNARVENNGDAAVFLLQSAAWLREQDDLLQIPPKFLTSTPVSIDATRAWTLLGGFLLLGLLITFGGTGWAIYRRSTR